MQHMAFIMLKILNLFKITYIFIVIKRIKHYILYKVSDYIRGFFLKNKSISENAVGSCGIVNLYIPPTLTSH